LITATWANSSDDETVLAWSEDLLEKIHATNAEKGVARPDVYMNDAADYQKPFQGYPPANLARLKDIRAEYDPDLVFRNLVPGGYKLD
jgi:FAD/FMN-containing dehydrogenase